MSLSEESFGLALVRKWVALSAEIQVSLKDVNSTFLIVGEGQVARFEDMQVLVQGERFQAWLDLTDVNFEAVVTEEALQGSDLSPDAYGESVTVSLPVGKCVLTALARLRPKTTTN